MLLFGVALFVVVVAVGSEVERRAVLAASDTASIYASPAVCSAVGVDEATITTHDSHADSTAAGASVVHCGACGHCSNGNDIDEYLRTRNTLTDTVTACALRSLVSRSSVEVCMEQEVGLSDECNECWVDNIMCDKVSEWGGPRGQGGG